MKHWDMGKVKLWGRRILSAIFCVGAMTLLFWGTAARAEEKKDEQTSANVLMSALNGQIPIVEWNFIPYPESWPKGEYYVAVLTEKNTTSTGIVWDGSTHLPFRANNWIPRSYRGNIPVDDMFYTVGRPTAMLVYYDGSSWDGDNHCPKIALYWCDENGAPSSQIGRDDDWDVSKSVDFSTAYYADLRDNYFARACSIKLNSVDPKPTTDGNGNILPDDVAKNYTTLKDYYSGGSLWSAAHPYHDASYHCFCFIHNKSASRDPAMRIADSGTVYCEKEKDWGDRCWFQVWYGKPTLYSLMKDTYALSEGQTLSFNAKEEAYKGVYISRNATLVVGKGSTLSINEPVYNDGTIIVDGGTLLIQSEGRLSPMASDGKNEIKVLNDGVVIIMNGGGLYTTDQYPMILCESRLINFGTYLMGGNMFLYSSFVENRDTGVIVTNRNFQVDRRPFFATADLNSLNRDGAVSGMTTNDSKNKSRIYLYDTKAHYATYGCMDNNGAFYRFDETADVIWAEKTSDQLRDLIRTMKDEVNATLQSRNVGYTVK